LNYVWEILQQGALRGIAQDEIRFAPSKTANPYREISFPDINVGGITKNPIEVNALYRYSSVFGRLIGEDMSGNDDLRDTLFDLFIHFLSGLDLREGLCRAEYYSKFLHEDISAGLYGASNAKAIGGFSPEQIRHVLAALLRLHRTGASSKLLAKLLRELYPHSITYLDTRNQRELLIYIGKKKTTELELQLELLCELFVPIDYVVHLFWNKHFGIIDTQETMEIGDIMMY